jgi:hypothetical protein
MRARLERIRRPNYAESVPNLEEMLQYLDALRYNGKASIWALPGALIEEFDVTPDCAADVALHWLQKLSDRQQAERNER